MLCSLQLVAATPQDSPNKARQEFDKIYNMVFGPQGSTLRYDVNIIGIYKTHGTIWYKGKKQCFSDERVNTWNDGVTAYMVFRRKRPSRFIMLILTRKTSIPASSSSRSMTSVIP